MIGIVFHKEIIPASPYSSYFLQINFHKIFVLHIGFYHHFTIIPCSRDMTEAGERGAGSESWGRRHLRIFCVGERKLDHLKRVPKVI